MKRIVTLVLLCLCALVEAAPSAKKQARASKRQLAPAPSKTRIAEIASYLPAEPAAAGARISDRKAWDRLAALDEAAAIIKKAEDILKRDVPECPDKLYLEYSKTGIRKDYQIPYNDRIYNAETLATAECLENKERFLPKLSEYLEAICAERSWVQPAHDPELRTFDGQEFNVDLGASERAWRCAWIVSALKGSMSGVLAMKVRKEIDRRVFSTYRDCLARTSNFAPLRWFNGPANWTAVCHCDVVRAALAIVEDRMDRAAFVEAAERMLPFYIAGFPEDGYCSEGMGYWNYGWGHYMQLALTVKDATGGKVDFFKNPKTKTIMSFGVNCQMEEGFAPDFADGGGLISDSVIMLGQRQWPDLPVTSSSLKQGLFCGGVDVFTLRAFGQIDDLPRGRVDPLPVRNVFQEGQVWVFRPEPGNASTAFSVALKGGHNAEFHNHNDVGSYSVRFGGVVLAGDPGGTEYTALTFSSKRYTIPLISSYGHPVPVLNGCYQEAGREHAARIIAAAFSNDVDRVTMEIGGAYPKNAKVKSDVRTFVYDRRKKEFSVTDQIRLKKAVKVSVPILTFGFIEPKEGASNGQYRLKASDNDVVRECDVSINVKGAKWKLSDGKRIDNPNRHAPMRYAILVEGPVQEVEVSVKFTAIEELIAPAIAAEPQQMDEAETAVEEKPGPILFDEEAGVKASIVYSGLEERVLAREIRWYLGEMTDETFPLAEAEPIDGPAVVLKVDEGKGRVFTRGNRVYISGHGSGLSRAVSHFLEELGVRYLMPGDIGRVIPGKTKVMYPDSDWHETPHPLIKETPSPEKRQLISMLKSSTPIKRGFYAWHCVDITRMPYPTADGWDLYRAAKGVDPNDKAACEALLTDFRRAAYGPVARIMKEYFDEKANPSPNNAKLKEILDRAAVETEHEPAISSRIQSIRNSIW